MALTRRIKNLQNELRELRMSQPFRPFKVVMKDGKSYTVRQRLWYAFNDKGMVVLPDGDTNKHLKFDDVDSVKPVKNRKS
jgi:uncharacterized protein (DUF302 family)